VLHGGARRRLALGPALDRECCDGDLAPTLLSLPDEDETQLLLLPDPDALGLAETYFDRGPLSARPVRENCSGRRPFGGVPPPLPRWLSSAGARRRVRADARTACGEPDLSNQIRKWLATPASPPPRHGSESHAYPCRCRLAPSHARRPLRLDPVRRGALPQRAPTRPPLARARAARLYAPWAWIGWNARYGARAPTLFRNASAITTVAVLLGCVPAIGSALRRMGSGPSGAHGSSRWATTKEIQAAGFLRDAGVVLCQTNDAQFRTTVDAARKTRTRATRLGQLVRHDGPEHVVCFAPTRSGKGVALVIPTLLSWPHSVLVYDIKKKNWALTAGWHRQFSRAWRFEPTATDSVRFNPLLEIRKGLSEVKDTQNVADILVDPTGEKDSKDHWQTTAHSLLCGSILHVLHAEPDKTQ
jgi:hypothetical protein